MLTSCFLWRGKANGTGTKLGFEPTLTGSKGARIRALDVILSSKKLTVPISVGKNLNIILCDSTLNNFEHVFRFDLLFTSECVDVFSTSFPISNQWWFGLSQRCRFLFCRSIGSSRNNLNLCCLCFFPSLISYCFTILTLIRIDIIRDHCKKHSRYYGW